MVITDNRIFCVVKALTFLSIVSFACIYLRAAPRTYKRTIYVSEAVQRADVFYGLDNSSASAPITRAILEKLFGVDLGVFVCVTGQRGRLELDSKRQNLLRPLRDYFRTVDVAFVMSQDAVFLNDGHDAELSQPTLPYNLTLAISDLATGVAEHDFFPPADPVLNKRYIAQLNNERRLRPRRFRSHVSQWTMYLWCEDLLHQMEAMRGRPYTHVIRTRDDSFFTWPVAVPALAEVLSPTSARLAKRGWRTRPLWDQDGTIPVVGLPPTAYTHNSTRMILRPLAVKNTRARRARVSRAGIVGGRAAVEAPSATRFLQLRSEATAEDVIARMRKLDGASHGRANVADEGRQSWGRTAHAMEGSSKAWSAPLRNRGQFSYHVAVPQCDDSGGINDKFAMMVRPVVSSFFGAPLLDLNVYFNMFHNVETAVGFLNSEQLLHRALVRRGLRIARVASRIACPTSSRFFGKGRWCAKFFDRPSGLLCYADGNATLEDRIREFVCWKNASVVLPGNVQRLFGIRSDVPADALLPGVANRMTS
eukprot:TRINITY_DN669_c0_g2_i1.p1 TRINITY_DN669_c0_g2~~TRINITY_DN669_c0_g2_i1.p1  ORF type:complete len:535 (-),score=37.55 TRINITY_DN669_c0_g2_i1:579-2183(-)